MMTLAKWMTTLALAALVAAISGIAPGAAPDGNVCEESAFPECLGSCGLGEECKGDPNGSCACFGGGVPCNESDPATCGGTCPNPGQECKLPPGANSCQCVDPVVSCDQSAAPTCGGDCPPDSECLSDATGNRCACKTIVIPCDQSDPATCGGDCPPDSACAIDLATDKCACKLFPCEQSDPATCGGECPAGSTCETDGAGGACRCIEIGRPCTQCGPGPHFIDACGPFPPVGTDLIANSGAVVGIDLNFDCIRDTNLVLVPCPPPHNLLHINKTLGPIDDSVNFPNTSLVDGHPTGPGLDVIDTEIVSMCLTNGVVTLIAGAAGPSTLPLQQSLGTVAEDLTTPDPTMANSFFDVFFEVTGVPGGPVYNREPLRVESRIECLPPAANYLHLEGMCIPLTTAGFCEKTGLSCVSDTDCSPALCIGATLVANLVSANHSVNQPVCDTGKFPNCLGDCAAGDKCEADTANGVCVCASEVVPCEDSDVATCGGDCQSGEECVPDGAGQKCVCQPLPVPCEESGFPVCDGACPPDSVCASDEATEKCFCKSLLCDQSDPATCGGECPPDMNCAADSTGTKCRCFPKLPPAGTDLSPTVGIFRMEVLGVGEVDAKVHGMTLLAWQNPQHDPATGKHTTQTEMLSMDLSGFHPSIGNINVKAGSMFGLPPTLGTVVPLDLSGDFPALATFDVFFEVEVVGVATMRNSDPLIMQQVINEIPPRNTGLRNTLPVLITDVLDPTSVHKLDIGFHWMCPPPFPPPGVPCPVPCSVNPFPVCGFGDCPVNEECVPDDASGRCTCQPLPIPCDESGFPVCDGTCPSDSTCVSDKFSDSCHCEVVSCQNSDPATCGGECPNPGDICTPDAAGNVCKCEPPPVLCEDSDKATCDGECANPDEICTFDPAGGPCKCLPPIPMDCDGDGDVDLDDVVRYIRCISGPNVPYATGCECSDFDGDGDVDLGDGKTLQKCFSGDGVLGDPNCGN